MNDKTKFDIVDLIKMIARGEKFQADYLRYRKLHPDTTDLFYDLPEILSDLKDDLEDRRRTLKAVLLAKYPAMERYTLVFEPDDLARVETIVDGVIVREHLSDVLYE